VRYAAMRKSIRLRTADGKLVALHLDNWGGGVDRLYRRWIREPDSSWRCVETGESASPLTMGIFGVFSKAAAPPRWRA
jgi:hypothetical protein